LPAPLVLLLLLLLERSVVEANTVQKNATITAVVNSAQRIFLFPSLIL
jgi:hypothetical protein